MRTLHFGCRCLCSFAIVVAVMTAQATAEPVQATFSADAHTTGLWLFKEGQGADSACEVKGMPPAVLRGATWVPGREGFALAMHSGYVAIADNPAMRPEKGFTVEAWVKLARAGGDLFCKNSVYMIRLGGTMKGLVGVDGKWQTVEGRRNVPTGRWTHLAVMYDAATRTATTYIDGVVDATLKVKGDTPGLVTQGKPELRLGLNDWNPLGSEVDGKIAALRVSDVARKFEPIPQAAREPVASKGNLVPNGDFEMGLVGWRLSGEGDATLIWTTDTKDAASGHRSLHNIPGAPAPASLLSRPIPVNPGGTYTFSIRLRGSARVNPRIEVSSAGAGGGFIPIKPFPIYPTVDTKWMEAKQSFTVPADFAAPSVCVSLPFPDKGELWVDDVRLMAGDSTDGLMLKDKISVGPETVPVGHLYFADQASPATLDIVNTDAAAHKVSVQAIAVDCEGQPLPAATVGTFDVPAGGVKTATFNIDTSHKGTFRLGFELSTDGQTWRQSAEYKYAVVVPLKGVGNAEDSAFAMNTHMEREPTPHLARSMEVLSECGVKWIRAWWGWGMCEQTKGQFNFAEFDRQFNTVAGAKMCVMPILLRYYNSGYGFSEKAWAGPTTRNAIQECPFASEMPEFGAWAGKVAQRYAGKITAYEIWNEPTMGSSPNGDLTSQQYADMLKASSPVIRQNDPKAKIIGFAGVPLDYLKKTLKLERRAADGRGERAFLQPDRDAGDQSAQADQGRASHFGALRRKAAVAYRARGRGRRRRLFAAGAFRSGGRFALYAKSCLAAVAGDREILLVLGPVQPDVWHGHLL